MNMRNVCFSLSFAALSTATLAADGLLPPTAETLWPQWHARVAMQTSAISPLGYGQLADGTAQRGLQGGSIFGDYVFAKPSFGAFRASGGLLVGSQGGTPLLSASAGPRLSLAVNSGGPLFAGSSPADSPGAATYLGLGFSGAAWHSSLAVTADVGMVAERPGAAGGVGRAIFGNQGMESALRDLRLSPMLQLGMRYSF